MFWKYAANLQENTHIEITLRDGCSPVNLLYTFTTPFPKKFPKTGNLRFGTKWNKTDSTRVFNWKSRNGFHKTVSAAYVKDTYIKWVLINNRSSCLEVFCRKGILWNFAKFTGKHLCQSLLGLLIEYFYC